MKWGDAARLEARILALCVESPRTIHELVVLVNRSSSRIHNVLHALQAAGVLVKVREIPQPKGQLGKPLGVYGGQK